jgi:hypothetical protein
MGDTCSTVKELDYGARYYFNDTDNINKTGIEKAPININNVQMEENVSLSIEIKNVDISSEHRVELITKEENKGISRSKSVGFTERKAKNPDDNTIIFQQFFTIPYYFEKQQLLEFRVYFNNNENELIQTSLGSIMGGRGQTLKKKLSNGEDIFIKGNELKKSSKEIVLDIKIQGNNLVGTKYRYSVVNRGTDQKPDNKKLYDSEVKGVNKNTFDKNQIVFLSCKIPLMYLNPGGERNDNLISIEFSDIIHRREIGNYQGYFSNIKNSNHLEIVLFNNIKAIINCKIESHPTFISYLRSGINIGLTIGIDFTGSNGHYKDPPSLHYLGGGLNNYESAIRSCGDIVSAYDKEQSFPVFAFGFNFINESLNNFEGKYTDFNYPINCNTENPAIKYIDGVLQEYRNFITKIHLAGPTYFSPMINDLIFEVEREIEEGQLYNYHIIMILTDGMIDDMAETKDSLVAASFLPISVIIIGIGNGDFTKMDILDADVSPLYDSTGRKADRDLVQFVPYNQFKNNPQQLAEQVLEEIPRQVVEYFQHKGIEPNE